MRRAGLLIAAICLAVLAAATTSWTLAPTILLTDETARRTTRTLDTLAVRSSGR
jgi:hypothetical protein